MKLNIHYQTEHSPIEANGADDLLLYYPDAGKNPSKQVYHAEDIINKLDNSIKSITLVSDSPYYVEAIEVYLRNKIRDYKLECFIDNVSQGEDLNSIFKLFSEPMKRLFMLGLIK